MTTCSYCTPQWLEETERIYQSNPEFKSKLKKLTAKICYRVKALPEWGIDDDILFGMFFNNGDLDKIGFFSEDSAKNEADFVMGATPQVWKKLLRKERKFITDFMLGKVKLEQGSKVGVLAVAPHANDIVDALTQIDLVFPDELSSEGISEYRSNMTTFRAELGV